MLTPGIWSEKVRLHRVRLYGAANGHAARRKLESALVDVNTAAVDIPPQALLVVRRMVPSARLRGRGRADAGAFADSVRAGLRQHARHARRPWREGDAAAAPAVLFADEAELMACLLRDWARGVLSERWWWPAVAGGLSPSQWWRRHVLPRGDVLPAVLEHLAAQGAASGWVMALDEHDTARAISAIAAAHGLKALPDAPPRISRREIGAAQASRVERHVLQQATDARRALLERVPEVAERALQSPQRRLLALGLALRRAPVWARSRQFVTAVESLEMEIEPPTLAMSATPDSQVAGQSPVSRPPTAQRSPSHGTPSTFEEKPGGKTESPRESPAATISQVSSEPPSPTPDDARGKVHTLRHGETSMRWAADTVLPRVEAPEVNDVTVSRTREGFGEPRWVEAERGIDTAFGGIFYLLNVALALGLYGDFTRPRAPGIALSPWDFLALAGRAWFGRAFIRDPVWALLADLAGRGPGEEPGQGFDPPGEWSVPDEWLTPLGAGKELGVAAGAQRLCVWHQGRFAVLDVARGVDETPFAQAHRLFAAHATLRGAKLVRARRQRHGAETGLERWLARLLPYVRARLARALGIKAQGKIVATVCRHPATVRPSSLAVDVHLSLETLPISLRIAGLDRDPGWIPAAGRTVAFHFG